MTPSGRNKTASLLAGAAAAALLLSTAQAQTSKVPDLSGFWGHTVPQIDYENPPEGGPGPVRNTLPVVGNNPIWVGNYQNPILKPHAAEAVKRYGELEKVGKGPPTAQMLCMMSGVPTTYTLMGVMQFLQTDDMVHIVHQRDHQIRRVYLNRKHSENPKPSWYGESVGHYEGDTLVIDTIGLNDKTVTDRNGTPHSEAMHVVERIRVANDGRLEIRFTVDDPNTFNMPWSAVTRYTRNARQTLIEEEVCAENNFDVTTNAMFPIPVAEKPEF
jgi:hypothetical protein